MVDNIIELLRQHNLLKIINESVDIDLEIPHIAFIEAKKEDSKALLFLKPVSKRLGKEFHIPVLMNIFSSKEALKLIFGKDPQEISKEIDELMKLRIEAGFRGKAEFFTKLLSLKNIPPKRVGGKGICQEFVKQGDKVNLFNIPILTTWPDDGGAFITMGQVYTQSLDGKLQNLGMYRMQVYDKNHLGVHWQIHKDGMHFFNEYKKENKKMPISIAIGGDPLYIWCAQTPMPYGFFELLLYGFIRNKKAKLIKSLTNPIYVPDDADLVLEGWVNPQNLELEGPFGDHTGFYTPKELYPVMEVTCITSKLEPIYHATVVGKPPIEDKYMGQATARIFLPLLKTTTPELIDYDMPENGVFHNLILAKMKTRYFGHAKQFMHAFWGVGQMSFVKHAIFVGEDAPPLHERESISRFILNRINKESIIISEGICDALDHASPNACYGGKLGLDCTISEIETETKEILGDVELLDKMSILCHEIKDIKQFMTDTKTPVTFISIKKERAVREVFRMLRPVRKHTKLLVFTDAESDDIENLYMLIWKVTNNIDAKRDIFIEDEFFGIDATKKGVLEGYEREWPNVVNCDKNVLERLKKRALIDIDDDFAKRFWI
ncbi:MAG: menaquinone biosynthesis decarboxylase [Campylobacteraceae bacterium]|jgi:4-hydroxy-3-polyprenylbenzoate decarboxylase|nr:menaquinone biosynthesis decarboxylase [Campylobacteraceae bacterium]